MKLAWPDWNPMAACLLTVPMGAVVGAIYVWLNAALPVLLLLAGIAALLGYLGGVTVAPILGLVLGVSLPGAVYLAASMGFRLPYDALWISDGLLPTLLATLVAYAGAAVRWAGHQWSPARQV